MNDKKPLRINVSTIPLNADPRIIRIPLSKKTGLGSPVRVYRINRALVAQDIPDWIDDL